MYGIPCRYGMVSPSKKSNSPRSETLMAAGRKTPVKRSLNSSFTFGQEDDEETFKTSIQVTTNVFNIKSKCCSK